MGRYDDITAEELRRKLVRVSALILKLEEKGLLLEKTPEVLKLLGQLRQMLFAWEVRGARSLGEEAGNDPEEAPGPGDEVDTDGSEEDEAIERSLRVVRDALEREQELQDELRDPFFEDD